MYSVLQLLKSAWTHPPHPQIPPAPPKDLYWFFRRGRTPGALDAQEFFEMLRKSKYPVRGLPGSVSQMWFA